MKVRLTRKADADIAAVLRTTRKLFGNNQVHRYAGIISDGIDLIVENPSRPVCRRHDDLALGVKSMHLEHVQAKRGSASHLLFFIEQKSADGTDEIVVLGLLHERMIPRRQLAQVLRVEGSK